MVIVGVPDWVKKLVSSPELTDGDLYHLYQDGYIDAETCRAMTMELREFTLTAPLTFFDKESDEKI
jgi:hypothetical protein